jgi:hypothetical protein
MVVAHAPVVQHAVNAVGVCWHGRVGPAFDQCHYTSKAGLSTHVHGMWGSFMPLAEGDSPEGMTEPQKDPTNLWTIGAHADLTKGDIDAVQAVLLANKAAFAYAHADLPGYKGVCPDVDIELTNTHGLFSKQREYSALECEVRDEKCGELLQAGMIEEGQVGDIISCPTLPLKKGPDGLWTDRRYCIDFRRVNSQTKIDRYPMPLAEELFRKCAGARFYSKLDLRAGFHQLPLTERAKDICSFWWGNRCYRYTRLPFGLVNATAAFQRVVDTELARANCSAFCKAFVDDLLIYSDTLEDHLQHIAQVLQCLHACGLRAHPEKSVFAAAGVEYLGHMISGVGLSPTEAKVASIRRMPHPSNVAELRSVLGFVGFYRSYIPNYSAITKPLTALTGKGVAWTWGAAEIEAFETVRELLCTDGVGLHKFDPTLPIELHTDFSVKGISAILIQRDALQQPRLVAASSRSLNSHEARYTPWKGELLGLTYGVRMYRSFLHGRRFRAVTDHRPLLWLLSQTELNGQHMRWLLALQEFDFEVEHRPGVDNVADAMSRLPQEGTGDCTGAKLDADGESVGRVLPDVLLQDGSRVAGSDLIQQLDLSAYQCALLQCVTAQHHGSGGACVTTGDEVVLDVMTGHMRIPDDTGSALERARRERLHRSAAAWLRQVPDDVPADEEHMGHMLQPVDAHDVGSTFQLNAYNVSHTFFLMHIVGWCCMNPLGVCARALRRCYATVFGWGGIFTAMWMTRLGLLLRIA